MYIKDTGQGYRYLYNGYYKGLYFGYEDDSEDNSNYIGAGTDLYTNVNGDTRGNPSMNNSYVRALVVYSSDPSRFFGNAPVVVKWSGGPSDLSSYSGGYLSVDEWIDFAAEKNFKTSFTIKYYTETTAGEGSTYYYKSDTTNMPEDIGDTEQYASYTVQSAPSPPLGRKFLYWRSSDGNIYSPGNKICFYKKNTDLTLTAVYDWEGIVHVYDNGSWKNALPYIYTGSEWKQALPYICTDAEKNTWSLGIGSS